MSETSPARHAYGYQRKTPLDLTAAIAAITAALKEEGFGVLMSLDLQVTLRQKLGVERPPYTILGACNPALANPALAQEPEIGLLLPCNVVVYADANGETVVSASTPRPCSRSWAAMISPRLRERSGRDSRAPWGGCPHRSEQSSTGPTRS